MWQIRASENLSLHQRKFRPLQSNKFTVTINDAHTLELTAAEIAALDIVPLSDNRSHILHEHKSYHAYIEKVDFLQKQFSVTVNGNTYRIKIADEYETLVNKLGLASANKKKANDLKAPMPGLVRDVKVTVGDTVVKGEPLLILEAMKMENVIRADAVVTIKSIHTAVGDAVDKNQLLIAFE